MAAVDWPRGDELYRVEVFLVIEIQKGGAVGPEDAVAWLADILGAWHEFTEKEAYQAMANEGIPMRLPPVRTHSRRLLGGEHFSTGSPCNSLRSTFAATPRAVRRVWRSRRRAGFRRHKIGRA